MANKVLFEIVATAKGVNIVQKQTDKLAKSTDKARKSTDGLSKSRDNYNRKEKGAAGISSNSTKNFSKMQQGIDGGGGSGGLVRAYALLAANVFALTAAFGVLSRSAQIDTLTQSMEILSTTGGTYIKSLAKDMQQASGGAIDLAQSFRQVSLASSAGLNTSEIEGLTQVAKGAAISLGRDLPDAMDRIFRGAIKLEPEILDEIGLFVRVDEAAQKYATSVGKSAGALTQAEKRQGFLNEILEQGKNKFQEYAETVKPDPYVRLGAALGDIAQAGISLLNGVLGPVLEFLAESKGALTVVFGVLVFSLLKKAIPAMGQFNAGLADQAKKAADNAKKYSDGVRESTKVQLKEDKKKLDSSLKTLQKQSQGSPMLKLKVGGKDASGILEKKLQDKTIKGKKREALIEQRILDLTKKQGLAKREQMAGYDAELKALQKEKQLNQEILDIKNQKPVETSSGSLAGRRQSSLEQKSSRLAIVSGATNVGENEGMGAGFSKLKGDLKKNTGGLKTFGKAATFAQGSVSILGGGISRLMMMLGPFMMLFSMLAPLAMMAAKALGIGSAESKKFDNSLKNLGEMQETINKRFDTQTNAMDDATLSFLEQTKAAVAYNKAQQGTFVQLDKLVKEFENFQREASSSALAWESLKSIFGMDKETKLIEGQANAIANSIRAAALAGDESQLSILAKLDNAEVDTYIEKVKVLGEANKVAIAAEAALENDSFKNKANLIEVSKSLSTALAKEAFWVEEGMYPERVPLEERLTSIKEGLTDKELAYVEALVKKNAAIKTAQAASEKMVINEMKMKGLIADSAKSTKEQTLAMQSYVDAQKGAITSFGKFRTAFDIKTPVDAVINSFDELEKTFVKMVRNTEGQMETAGGMIDPVNFFKNFGDKDNAFTSLFSKDEIEKIKGGAKDLFFNVIKELKQYQENILSSKSLLKDFAATQALAAKGAKVGGQALAVQQTMITKIANKNASVSAAALKIKERGLIQDEKSKELAIDIVNGKGTIAEQEEKLLAMNIERKDVLNIIAARREDNVLQAKSELATDTEIARVGMMQQQINLKALKVQEDIQKMKTSTLLTDAKMLQASKTGSSTLDPVTAAKMTMEASVIALENAIKQATIKKAMLDFEFKILELQMRVLAKQAGVTDMGNDGENGKDRTGMFKTLDDTENSAGELIDRTLTDLTKKTALGFQEAIATGFKGGLSDGLATGANAIAAYNASLTSTDADGVKTTKDADPETLKALNFTVARESAKALAADLSKLGPEGELVSSVVLGAMAIGDAFSTMTTAMETAGKDGSGGLGKAVAMAEFASAAIGQVTQMMAANSKAQMAEMDGQIAAEKRRDGKSKESLAKIAQLEKKKEAMAKKAFEQNKKMQMAQVVVNTASGMMRAYKDYDGMTATGLAIMIGALGAAQLAIISKTQYAGAGAGDIPKPQTNLSIGNRSNKVDVSRGGNGGELSYMRGARGTGNANNFTPGGAMGRKGYAAGGEGILVGERGPEIVRPSQKVDIIPNDRLGGNTNVNFSINAVDAAGVEDLLINQRGNIIRMIREAANDTGERFLESVDTQTYGSST